MTMSVSGETRSPNMSTSSPVLEMTVTLAGSSTWTRPWRNREAPTPPAKTVIMGVRVRHFGFWILDWRDTPLSRERDGDRGFSCLYRDRRRSEPRARARLSARRHAIDPELEYFRRATRNGGDAEAIGGGNWRQRCSDIYQAVVAAIERRDAVQVERDLLGAGKGHGELAAASGDQLDWNERNRGCWRRPAWEWRRRWRRWTTTPGTEDDRPQDGATDCERRHPTDDRERGGPSHG